MVSPVDAMKIATKIASTTKPLSISNTVNSQKMPEDNIHHISFELSPGEGTDWGEKYGENYGNLPENEQYNLTKAITTQALHHAAKISGVKVDKIAHGTGGWENYQNPSAVAQVKGTDKQAEVLANLLGHVLQQTEVWSNKTKPISQPSNATAVDFMERQSNNLSRGPKLQQFWSNAMNSDPHKDDEQKAMFKGFQPIIGERGQRGIRTLINRNDPETLNDIHSAIGNMGTKDIVPIVHGAEVLRARNDWNENPKGEAYLERLKQLTGKDLSGQANNIRGVLENSLQKRLNLASKDKNSA